MFQTCRGGFPGASPLAVEYADTGQDERELQAKIHTLPGAGVRYVCVQWNKNDPKGNDSHHGQEVGNKVARLASAIG